VGKLVDWRGPELVQLRAMMSHSHVTWQRGVILGMGLLIALGLALVIGIFSLIFVYQSAVYPDATHISSSYGSNGLNQIYAGAYRWEASTVTFFESTDTPDKIIKWYGPRHKNKSFNFGPVAISLNTNEVHYTYPILYRISTQITVAFDSKP